MGLRKDLDTLTKTKRAFPNVEDVGFRGFPIWKEYAPSGDIREVSDLVIEYLSKAVKTLLEDKESEIIGIAMEYLLADMISLSDNFEKEIRTLQEKINEKTL